MDDRARSSPAARSPKAASCIPCAKRKVKCDRVTPCCSNCKRRKKDTCEYPVYQPVRTLVQSQHDRIRFLEAQIANAGVNLEIDRTSSTLPLPVHDSSEIKHSDAEAQEMTPKSAAGGLIENEQQTTYVDSTMWFCMDEALDAENEDSINDTHAEAGYSRSLLDGSFHGSPRAPSAEVVRMLWKKYLTNIHPIMKLFFDWDKEPLIFKAACDPENLSKAQHAFVFAVYFITAHSLTEADCQTIFGTTDRTTLLDHLQSSTEAALTHCQYAVTNELLVLQAFCLYIVTIRNRIKPAATFSLMGIAVRIAQRLGIHRDGSVFDISAMRAEERRRVWWQMQHMEIMSSQHLGAMSMTLFANWDTALPLNIEDSDISADSPTLPSERHGLTGMSHCLWRYSVLAVQRVKNSRQRMCWETPDSLSAAEKHAAIEAMRKDLAARFLQHCELVNPLHVQIQVEIQNAIQAFRRATLQPGPKRTKVKDMVRPDRDALLEVCIKCMEYFVIAFTNDEIVRFRWYNETFMQWTAFIYILVEAEQRANEPNVLELWTIIDKVCKCHPKLTVYTSRPEYTVAGRLIIKAWQRRRQHVQRLDVFEHEPWCYQAFAAKMPTVRPLQPGVDCAFELDFDMIDWEKLEASDFIT